jgi:hypothetical protein
MVPEGSAPTVVIWIGKVPMGRAIILVLLAPEESVTRMEKVNRPVCVGVPERRPAELRPSPGGRLLEFDQVYGGVPPETGGDPN